MKKGALLGGAPFACSRPGLSLSPVLAVEDRRIDQNP